MTVGLSASVVNAWLDGTFATASNFVKLHTGDPGASGASSPAAGDTTRKQGTMGPASGGTKGASGAIGPWTNGGTTETLSHISLWSNVAAGTFNGSVALSVPQTWAGTNTFTLTSLIISVAPIAA